MLSFRRAAPRLAALLSAGLLLAVSASWSQAQPQQSAARQAAQAVQEAQKDQGLTLEKIFPQRSPFGPSATGMTFSHDGRYAAFLYRPYEERRHGSDLYIYDTESGQSRRITSASRMAEYQASARRVVEDRTKKAKDARHPRVAEIEARDKKPAARGRGGARSEEQKQQDEQEQKQAEKQEEAQSTEQTQALLDLVGSYGGQISDSSDPARIEPGSSCRLLILRDGEDVSGLLHAGIVRLPLRELSLEGDLLTAMVGDGDDGLDGAFEATVNQVEDTVTLDGGVRLVLPELTFGFEARRDRRSEANRRSQETPQAQETADAAETAAAREKQPEEESAAEKRRYAAGLLNVEGEALELGDLVTRRDAEDERAPRYGGIQSVEWSPTQHKLLLQSEGDIYLLQIDPEKWTDADKHGRPYRGEIDRLTRTRERESSVAFLPDGSGYTYLRDGALLRVSFDEHKIVQLDPPLSQGERMVSYRISPDGKRLVFLAQKREGDPAASGSRRGGGGGGRGESEGDDSEAESQNRTRQVTLITYRDRFAAARQVPRQVADDEHPRAQVSIYLYNLEEHETEKATPRRILTRSTSGPRDVMYVPHWSPDSRKVAFAAFEQATGQVMVVEADFEEIAGKEQTPRPAPARPEAPTRQRDQERQDDGEEAFDEDEQEFDEYDDFHAQERTTRPARPEESEKPREPEFQIEGARIVYRFLHNGGPNTPRMIIPQYLADNRHMVFITELSGYRQLHVLDPVYERLDQITSGTNEIYPFHISRDHERLFVTATAPEDPAQEWVYQIDLATREMKRLCGGEGVMSRVAVSDCGRTLIGMKVDFGAPAELVAFDCSGDEPEETVLSDFHPEDAHKLTEARPEYFTFNNRHGHAIHGHMFKPADWTPQDQRPLLIYVYGGPLGTSKQISRGSYSGPGYFFARYMAEKHGWVTVTIDPRGVSGFGALFEKANFEQVGRPQTEDLVDAADWLVKHAGVDPKRRALHGWSFGGFQTQMVMYTEPEAFAAGIAGAGPTEWQNYNAWYTTGTVGPQSAFKEKVDQFSLLPVAKNLKGRLLLVHGMEDSNVLYQDTVRVYRELLKAGKEHLVDLLLDPTGGHGMGGDIKTIGRYRKYEDFLLTHLGKGEAAEVQEKEDSLDTEEPSRMAAAGEAEPKE